MHVFLTDTAVILFYCPSESKPWGILSYLSYNLTRLYKAIDNDNDNTNNDTNNNNASDSDGSSDGDGDATAAAADDDDDSDRFEGSFQSSECPSANEETLADMGKLIAHYNHMISDNKTTTSTANQHAHFRDTVTHNYRIHEA